MVSMVPMLPMVPMVPMARPFGLLLLTAAASVEKVQEAMDAMDVVSHLTVAMVTEVLDAQLLDLRSSARHERQLLRLGNTRGAKDVTWKRENVNVDFIRILMNVLMYMLHMLL